MTRQTSRVVAALWLFLIWLPVAGPALAQAGTRYDGRGFGHMMNWGGGWGGMILGPIFMIVILILTIVVVVAVLRWLGILATGPARAAGDESAREILERRFARGEIDEAEFKARKQALES